jgi:hypothetical protein
MGVGVRKKGAFYLSLLFCEIGQVQGLYAAVLVPTLIDPALSLPSVVVLAPPRRA